MNKHMNNSYELVKFWILTILIVSFGFYLFGQSTGTGTGGSAQNASTGSGGGSSGGVSTNGNNIFTGANTFTGPTYLTGISNVIGSSTTSNYFNGYLLLNTNGINTGAHTINFVPRNVNAETFNFNVGNAALNTGIDIGDFYNQLGAGSRYGRILFYTPGNNFQIHTVSASALLLGAQNNDQLSFGSGGNDITFGFNSSSTETHNGQTFTYSHNANFNNGMFILPVAGTGTITNRTSIYSPLLVSSNFTGIAPADLVARTTTPAGVTNQIITVNNGSGTISLNARSAMFTNTFSGPFVMNTIYTNTSSGQISISARCVFPTGLTTSSGAAIATVNGTVTNFMGEYTTCAGVSGAITNTIWGTAEVGDLWWGTNLTTGAGAPSAIQNGFTLKVR